MAVPLRLKVYKGEELIATRDFERDMIKIGRLSTAHLCLDDERASRIHAVLSAEEDGKLSIVDMGSMEGTYINGKRINKGTVQFGDEIRIGGTRILVGPIAAAHAEPLVSQTSSMTSGNSPVELKSYAGSDAAIPVLHSQLEEQPVDSMGANSLGERVDGAFSYSGPAIIEDVTKAEGLQRVQLSPETMVDEIEDIGHSRILRFREKPFDSYVVRKPSPRFVAESKGIGLQIRYIWGDQILGLSQYESPQPVYVGATSRCDFNLDPELIGKVEHQIVAPSNGVFSIQLGPQMSGEIDRQGKSRKMAYQTDLSPNDFAWVNLGGGIRAEFAFTVPPKRVAVPIAESIDYMFLNLFLLLAFIGGVFLVSAITRSEADIIADDLTSNRLAFAKVLIKEVEKVRRNALVDNLSAVKSVQAGEAATKHKGGEGQMGKKNAPVSKSNRSAPKAINIDAKDLVSNSGLLRILGRGPGGGISTIFTPGGLGGDIKGAVGNMFGSRVGESGGIGGMGLRGSGFGGGGVGNTIGISGISTKGRGGGNSLYGSGVGTLGGKKRAEVGIESDDAMITGSLDKEAIRRVIRRNIAQIKYCYESQLQTKPELSGKVAVRFLILPSGDVQTASVAPGSTLTDARVCECIVSRVRSWKFPSPKGGGSVMVTYPFVLKQAGE